MEGIKPVKNVWCLRSVSGAGKSFIANILCQNSGWEYVSADDYFLKDGVYNFDPTKLGAAHNQCKEKFLNLLVNPEVADIVVSNTNAQEKEIKFYQDESARAGANFISLVVENRHGGKNSHGVDEITLTRQAGRIKNSLKLV